MATEEVTFGPYRLRLQQTKRTLWEGIIVGRAKERFAAPSRAGLIHKLQQAVMSGAKGFIGLDGARQRFLAAFPGGFDDPAYLSGESGERGRLLALAESVAAELPPERIDAPDAPETALGLFRASDLADHTAAAGLAEVLQGPDARRFLDIAAEFATGSVTRACKRANGELAGTGANTWVSLTFFPFFWRRGAHMILDPGLAQDFARRIGDPFQYACDAQPNPATYLALLEMCERVKDAVQDIGARDRIDILGFMRVVGGYTDANIRELATQREG